MKKKQVIDLSGVALSRCPMESSKRPVPKAPEEYQASKIQFHAQELLELGIWNFSGAPVRHSRGGDGGWNLGFGAFPPRSCKSLILLMIANNCRKLLDEKNIFMPQSKIRQPGSHLTDTAPVCSSAFRRSGPFSTPDRVNAHSCQIVSNCAQWWRLWNSKPKTRNSKQSKWSLEFGISLELGTWDLELFHPHSCQIVPDRGTYGTRNHRMAARESLLEFPPAHSMLPLVMQKGRRTWNNIEDMRSAADEGDPQAQCYLGVCYQNGQGVQQDYGEAVKWFKKSADQNDPVAQCYLGVCYQAGLGVPQEYGQAAKWFREAAEQGDPAAQFNLGVLYETGQGVSQNYAEAVKWYHSAAEQGEPQAQFNLGVFYEQGHVVPQNYPEAVKWYRLAAEQEVAPAQCNLGLCYQTGRGVAQSTVDAVRWFIRAARQGDKTAQHNLGVHYATLEMAESAVEADENADPEQLPR